MMDYLKDYTKKLEPRAVLFIGFLLSYPLALIAANSIPIRLPIEELFIIAVPVWLLLFFLKPIKNTIASLLLVVQYLWFFSLTSTMPYYIKDGAEAVMPGAVKMAGFIYNNLFGEDYGQFIFYIRNMLTRVTNEQDERYYKLFIILIFVAIMAIVLKAIENRVNWKFFMIGVGYFIVGWFIYVSDLNGYFSLYFIGLTVYRQFMVYENLIDVAKKSGERTRYYNYSSAIFIGSVMMVAIIIVANIVLLFVPMDRINNRLHTYIPTIKYVRSDFKTPASSRIFTFNNTMYSPMDGILGGKIEDRDYSVIMRVKSEDGSQYLRGRAKNVYDGSKWTSDFDLYKNNVYKNVAIPEEHLATMFLYPDTLSSRTIFSPYKYYNSSFNIERIYGNEDAIVYRKTRTAVNLERYSVTYIKPEFVHLYDQLDEDLLESYLSYPSTGLGKTQALTNEIIEGIEDPYEIMKTLERYLRDNYRYSLSPGDVDTSQDFVEQFLFEEAQGYCTYFATSLAVMGRMANIPTRYVEGFLTSDFEDAGGFYEVTANRAHAWTEAYIEGRGWVRFEATPAYLNGDQVQEQEIFSDSLEATGGAVRDINEPINEPFAEEGEFTSTDDGVQTGDVVVIILYLVLLTGLLALVVSKVRRLRKDVHEGSHTEKINRRIHYLLSMSRLVDEDIDITKLPKVVITSNSEAMNIEMSGDVLRIIDQSLYSDKDFTEEDFYTFDNYFRTFELGVRSRITRVGHFMHKVVLNSLYHKDYYL